MAKDFRKRHGNRDKRAAAAPLERRIGRERQLGDLEFAVVQHTLKRVARAQHLDVEVDALGLDPPVHERAGAVIVPAREREAEIGHAPLTISLVMPSPGSSPGQALVPGISLRMARPCSNKRGGRDKPSHDEKSAIYRMMLGLRMAWSHSSRLTCLATIRS